jgi:hypothetical protein
MELTNTNLQKEIRFKDNQTLQNEYDVLKTAYHNLENELITSQNNSNNNDKKLLLEANNTINRLQQEITSFAKRMIEYQTYLSKMIELESKVSILEANNIQMIY